MTDFPEDTSLPARVSVLTEERDGTTTGYPVKCVEIREYIHAGGRLYVALDEGNSVEMNVDIIIVVDGRDYTFKPHPSMEDCFLLVDPLGREIPLLYNDLAGNGEYRVGESFIYGRLNLGAIEKIVLVSKGMVELGVPGHVAQSHSRILEALKH